jgi:hypothetical protein
MKIVIFACLAFVVGVAGGTGFGVMNAPKPAAVAAGADSAKAGADADALASTDEHAPVDGAPASAGGAPMVVSDESAHPAAGGAAPSGFAGGAPGADPHAGVVAKALAEVAARGQAREPEDFKQVARILTSMKPTDAAKIMSFLDDELIEGIVRQLGPRPAAVLLVQLPPERAARLSKRLIQQPTAEAR